VGLSGARGRGRPSVPPEPTPPPKAWGIVGGTFDPIHMGHLTVAEYVRDALDLGGVLFVPAAESPFKTARATSPAAHRVAMVELALADNDAFRVSRLELERPAPSYTVNTLEALHASNRICGPGLPDPVLILSAETLLRLVEWRRPERLLELCRIGVVPRPGHDVPTQHWLGSRFPGQADRFLILDGPELDHSSSEIRDRVAAGRSIRYRVPGVVARYIESQGLYRADAADGGR